MPNMIHAKRCKHVYSHLMLHTVYQVEKTRLLNWTRWLWRPRNAWSHSWPTVTTHHIWARPSTASWRMLQTGSRGNKNTTQLGPSSNCQGPEWWAKGITAILNQVWRGLLSIKSPINSTCPNLIMQTTKHQAPSWHWWQWCWWSNENAKQHNTQIIAQSTQV